MSDTPEARQSAAGWTQEAIGRFAPRRSFGLKLMLVCALAVMMSIPALFVFAINMDRSGRADEAVAEVSRARGGEQQAVGPFLVIPYDREVVETVPATEEGAAPTQRVRTVSGPLVLYAETGSADVVVGTDVLHRGIHDVPIFEAELAFEARFDLADAVAAVPPDSAMRWEEARVYLALSDLRGAKSGATVTVGGEVLELTPADRRGGSQWSSGHQADSAPALVSEYMVMSVVATPTIALNPARPDVQVAAQLAFSGAERLALTAFAQDTTVGMSSDWPSPSFNGGFLPVEREWGEDGFTAEWQVPLLARGAPRAGADIAMDALLREDLGVEFLNENRPYTFVTRALKYSPMFVGLVFLTYFLFEASSGMRAHPAQYILVGLAQMVFYLLLLSVSEHMGFNLAFVIAAGATVAMLALYAGTVFRKASAVYQAFAVFGALYAMIFILMRMQDYALLVGSLACFLAIALTMWMTRDLDWYGERRNGSPAR